MIHLTIQKEVPVIILITAILIYLSIRVGKKIKATDPLEKPRGSVMIACWLVEAIDKNVETMVAKRYVKWLSPYIGSIAIYIFVSNISGLLGIYPPTKNYSVTLTLALISWVMIQGIAIKETGVKAYLHGYIEPFSFLLIPNFFGRVAPLISLSLRLFGNILSGAIIMSLLYSFTAYLSGALFSLFGLDLGVINFIGPIVAPVLHAYFDLFAGFIQMFIFITLTMVFIGNELPQE